MREGKLKGRKEGEERFKSTLTQIFHTPSFPLASHVRGRLDLCRLLRSGVDLDKPTPSGSTGLTDACRRGRVEVVKYLVSEGADCNREGRQGFTPTLMACRGGKLEVVRILVEEGGGDFQDRKAGGKNGIEWAESQGDRGKEVRGLGLIYTGDNSQPLI